MWYDLFKIRFFLIKLLLETNIMDQTTQLMRITIRSKLPHRATPTIEEHIKYGIDLLI